MSFYITASVKWCIKTSTLILDTFNSDFVSYGFFFLLINLPYLECNLVFFGFYLFHLCAMKLWAQRINFIQVSFLVYYARKCSVVTSDWRWIKWKKELQKISTYCGIEFKISVWNCVIKDLFWIRVIKLLSYLCEFWFKQNLVAAIILKTFSQKWSDHTDFHIFNNVILSKVVAGKSYKTGSKNHGYSCILISCLGMYI